MGLSAICIGNYMLMSVIRITFVGLHQTTSYVLLMFPLFE